MKRFVCVLCAGTIAVALGFAVGGCGPSTTKSGGDKMGGKMDDKMDGKMGDKMDGKMGDKMGDKMTDKMGKDKMGKDKMDDKK